MLTLNGQNWGVYVNVQQYGKDVLKPWFDDVSGMRVKCANDPAGPGLQWFGPFPVAYSAYEIKDDGGLADPVGAIMAVCQAVGGTPSSSWPQIDQVFAIDPSIWTAVLENLFADDDSYVNKGCDFVLYRNPVDGRTHLHQTDGNESFHSALWSAEHGFPAPNRPFLSNVLDAPELRARWFAHMREALAELDPVKLKAEFDARRNLIDAAVQADPKKLYTYQQFLTNFTSAVQIGVPPFDTNALGLEQYVDQRLAVLQGDAELYATVPDIQGVAASSNQPGTPVHVTATVTGALPIASVTLYFRDDPTSTYQSTPMADDGQSGDGAAGDGVYGALLPVAGVGGQQVEYYVGAASQNAFLSTRFEPKRTELDPLVLSFQGGAVVSDVVINEFLARNDTVIQDPSGSYEDYVELYNRGPATVDLSGMYMSDSLLTPTEWQIPAGTTLASGQTLLIWADEDLAEAGLHADFKLGGGGEEIGLWDVDGTTLLDSIVFGPQEDDVSTGRVRDGDPILVTFPVPTPGALNDDGCGVREYDRLDPANHALDLDAVGSGSIGTTLTFTSTGMLAGSPALLAFDFLPAYIPLASGNVALMWGSALIPLVADGAGALTVPLGIPPAPQMVDLDVYLQVAGFDGGGAGAASNAIHLSICP